MATKQLQITEKDEIKNLVQVGKISCNLLHDFISPFTAMDLYLDSIDNQELKNLFLPLIESSKSIRNFIRLVQDTVENPRAISEFDLIESINTAILLGKNKALQNNVSIVFAKSVHAVKIKCRKLAICQIVMNLTGNAVDALVNKKGQRKIAISLSENQIGLRLTVKDNGCGISKKNLSKIFTKNFTTKENGMGIGLYTIKKIVGEEWDSKIIVKSQRGVGTTFHIYIPKDILIK